jgi:phospho-N-acetylmuramoyl-pentapeptide-transferase
MGGSFLVTSMLLSVVLWCRLDNLLVVLGILLTAGLAAVGFVDDYRKLTDPNSNGITPRAKLIGQSIATLLVLGALVFYAQAAGRDSLLNIYPPFFKDVTIPFGGNPFGILAFLVLGWFVVVGTSNAANITDGMDGLAAGCMLISGIALSIFCYVTGRPDWTGYLNLPHVANASEMAVVGGALIGACMGFLWYNAYPAQVFMGDSGSLPLGGAMAWMALVSKQELVLPLIAFVFVAELGSSWLQSAWYRHTGGRRLFTCAPVHHGLQLYGGVFQRSGERWHEATIVIRFWIIAAACAMASLALLKVR